uniref:ATP synthase complex subunit 8 n=1 Tax=Homorosoma asperum TaxID=3058427 RepID=A0AA51NHJ9_9CUCU|nr:ATP synthase F0 subunit 8 [Ceutorhynchus cf. asper XHL-2023]
MPQMAPINWVTLYFLFIFLLILLIITNYYMYIYTPKTCKMKINQKSLNWKW